MIIEFSSAKVARAIPEDILWEELAEDGFVEVEMAKPLLQESSYLQASPQEIATQLASLENALTIARSVGGRRQPVLVSQDELALLLQAARHAWPLLPRG